MIIRNLIIDIETTGLKAKDGDRIIEFCALEMINDQLTGNKLHLFFNPEQEISLEATKIHGLTLSELENKPKFADCAKEIKEFIFNSPTSNSYVHWIIHNAKFDVEFIKKELLAAGVEFNYNSDAVTCTLQLSRQLFPERENKHSLDALCNRFDINKSKRKTHGALVDCELLFQVYQKLIDYKYFCDLR